LRPDPLKLDRTLAVLLTATLELEVWAGHGAGRHRLGLALVGALMTAAIGVRRLYPAAIGISVGLLAVFVAAAWKPPELVSYLLAWMCAMYGLAVWSRSRQFVLGVGLITVATLISIMLPGARVGPSLQFLGGSLVAVLLVRRVVGDRERRAQLAERERDVAAREAVVEERARIARELHDAIAHNVSMIALQAGAERRMLDRKHGSTHEVLETIERIGRDALTEMRRLVGMLRSDAGDPLAPQPRLHDLPTLVSQVSEAGLPVELNVEGERRELPVGIELSAYRIVQEALTNALKHAGDARATIRVQYRPDTLELEVVDTGAGNGTGTPGGGHGLVGMRERVALCGGRFDAGRLPDGGFAVHVLLPLR
jgi:signal transduction histidine kinase